MSVDFFIKANYEISSFSKTSYNFSITSIILKRKKDAYKKRHTLEESML